MPPSDIQQQNEILSLMRGLAKQALRIRAERMQHMAAMGLLDMKLEMLEAGWEELLPFIEDVELPICTLSQFMDSLSG